MLESAPGTNQYLCNVNKVPVLAQGNETGPDRAWTCNFQMTSHLYNHDATAPLVYIVNANQPTWPQVTRRDWLQVTPVLVWLGYYDIYHITNKRFQLIITDNIMHIQFTEFIFTITHLSQHTWNKYFNKDKSNFERLLIENLQIFINKCKSNQEQIKITHSLMSKLWTIKRQIKIIWKQSIYTR